MSILPQRPKHLYKYQPIHSSCNLENYTLQNLEKHQIWFTKPIDLNDPFDCNIHLDTDIAETELSEAYQILRAKSDNPTAFDAANSRLSASEFKDLMIRGSRKFFNEHNARFIQVVGLACFSEAKDNLLMWAHYADCHKGICLEFDTAFGLFEKVRQVTYSEKVPSVNILQVFQNITHVLPLMIFTKASDWQYEKEWRVFNKTGYCGVSYEQGCLAGIYFGLKMTQDDKSRIMQLLQDSSVRFYEAQRNPGDFQIVFNPISLGK